MNDLTIGNAVSPQAWQAHLERRSFRLFKDSSRISRLIKDLDSRVSGILRPSVSQNFQRAEWPLLEEGVSLLTGRHLSGKRTISSTVADSVDYPIIDLEFASVLINNVKYVDIPLLKVMINDLKVAGHKAILLTGSVNNLEDVVTHFGIKKIFMLVPEYSLYQDNVRACLDATLVFKDGADIEDEKSSQELENLLNETKASYVYQTGQLKRIYSKLCEVEILVPSKITHPCDSFYTNKGPLEWESKSIRNQLSRGNGLIDIIHSEVFFGASFLNK